VGKVQVSGLDHLVLVAEDPEAMLAFYCGTLGLEALRVDEWRRGEVPFPSVRIDPTTIIDLLPGRRTGQNLDHLCLVVRPQDVAAVVDDETLIVLSGPARLFGAQGEGTGIYLADPEGNTVELRHYG
jgi:catechol 2,3-dioxygenase-like lactoylglutathione lyase family enzyme